ncbi:MAG TPA: tetratricopeptide repeat protein [Thermoanaerobaculia bacterium]|nr:tetratricopeptide repeat protein [Thermoanaerobaculia bacterium]
MATGIRTSDDDLREALDHIMEDDHHGALPYLARVVAFNPSNDLAYELWVACHTNVGREARAIELADEGLARGLEPVPLHAQKSRALRQLGRFDEAVQAATAAMELDPMSAHAIQARAAIEIDREQFDAAIAIYESAVRRNPDDEQTHFALLELLSDLERYDRVIEPARDYLRKFEKEAEVLEMLGRGYLTTKDFRRADRAFRDAARMEPDEARHHVNVGLVALLQDDTDALDSYLDKLADRNEELSAEVAEELQLLVERLHADEEEET